MKPSIPNEGIRVRRPIFTHEIVPFFSFLKTVDLDILNSLPTSCIVMKYGSDDDKFVSLILISLIFYHYY